MKQTQHHLQQRDGMSCVSVHIPKITASKCRLVILKRCRMRTSEHCSVQQQQNVMRRKMLRCWKAEISSGDAIEKSFLFESKMK